MSRDSTKAKGPGNVGASGRFVLRLRPALHESLRSAARSAGLSLNEYCVRRLSALGSEASAMGPPAKIVERAAAVCGDALVGVVAHGSWVRGEAHDGSDVDVLIVVRPSLRIDRELYRRWDEESLEWSGRQVDAHFVALNEWEGNPGALWAEVAIDGLVLFEHNFEVSSQLARVRREIAAGRLVRRFSHGQPYWAEGA